MGCNNNVFFRIGLMAPEPVNVDNPKFGTIFTRTSLLNVVPETAKKYKILPFDLYCPSVQPKIGQRICPSCGQYFPSQKARDQHKKALHQNPANFTRPKVKPKSVLKKRGGETLCHLEAEGTVEWVDDEDLDTENCTQLMDTNDDEGIPIIKDMFAWVASPWRDATKQ